jgi:hypothetical protein
MFIVPCQCPRGSIRSSRRRGVGCKRLTSLYTIREVALGGVRLSQNRSTHAVRVCTLMLDSASNCGQTTREEHCQNKGTVSLITQFYHRKSLRLHEFRNIQLVSYAQIPLENSNKSVHSFYPCTVDIGGTRCRMAQTGRWRSHAWRHTRTSNRCESLDASRRMIQCSTKVVCNEELYFLPSCWS